MTTYSSPFTAIKPIVITDAMLTSSTVSETEATWSAATTYALADVVKYGSDHDKFSSKSAGNINHIPIKYPNETVYWYDEGKTNKWNMFDLTTNIQTIGTSPLTVVLTPGSPITSLQCDAFECDEISVGISDGVSTVYTKTVQTRIRDVIDWYSFFYEQFRYKKSISLYDIPGGVSNPIITITFTSSTGTVKVGGCLIGTHYIFGETDQSSDSSRQGFSIFERDAIDPDRIRLLKRGAITRISAKITIEKRRIGLINHVLDDLDGIVGSYSGIQNEDSDWYQAFIIRGVYRSPINIRRISGSDYAILSMDLEGI